MEYIKKEDLIEGEIYVYNEAYINKITKLKQHEIDCWISKNSDYYQKPTVTGYSNYTKVIRLATSEEKHWLNECIKLDKFITFKEAMKTFIPEYVECVNNEDVDNYGIIGRVYKFNRLSGQHWGVICNLKCGEYDPNDILYFDKHQFIPSTKEAYDAQFVVKEPEFVLPKKWCINIELKPIEVLKYFNEGNKCNTYTLLHDDIYTYLEFEGEFDGNHIRKDKPQSQEITFEQFKKYVLKEEVVVENQFISFGNCIKAKEVIEPLPQFKIIETIETITKVENNEGNQFFIGDTITPIEGFNKGSKFVISGFRYNNAKTNICAITDTHSPNGIGIDKIEHYIETKVIEPEFILPEKWFIKTTQETFKTIKDWAVEKLNYPNYNDYFHFSYVSFNYLGKYRQEQYCTEITFDQFKKYVLKEEELSPIQLVNIEHPELAIVEESLLDKAKRLYPVGTKFKSANSGKIFTIKNHIQEECYNLRTIVFGTNELNRSNNFYACVHSRDNIWDEIIEYPHGFKIGDKIRSKYGNNDYYINKIEGNQLFFETNYLPKINSILAKNAIKVN